MANQDKKRPFNLFVHMDGEFKGTLMEMQKIEEVTIVFLL